MSDSLRLHGLQHARLPCPSPSPGACSNSCPLSRCCHPTISCSVVPFSSCLQSFPESGSCLNAHHLQPYFVWAEPASSGFSTFHQPLGFWSWVFALIPSNIHCRLIPPALLQNRSLPGSRPRPLSINLPTPTKWTSGRRRPSRWHQWPFGAGATDAPVWSPEVLGSPTRSPAEGISRPSLPAYPSFPALSLLPPQQNPRLLPPPPPLPPSLRICFSWFGALGFRRPGRWGRGRLGCLCRGKWDGLMAPGPQTAPPLPLSVFLGKSLNLSEPLRGKGQEI